MAKIVDDAFVEFHGRLTPSGTESAAAKSHRESIEQCLSKSFTVSRFFRTGSFGNGTSIRGYSDVDYFASVPPASQLQNSATMLKRVRDALDTRFPNTGVRIDSPAVVVPFGSDASETTEVVPAYYVGKDKADHRTYKIPDGAGGWLKSSPDTHNVYVRDVNDALSRKVKPLIRFIKAWAYYRDVPISMFYLELRATKYASSESSIVYAIDIRNILKRLVDNDLAAMQDPKGISGYIVPCATEKAKREALDELVVALERAQKAREAEQAGNAERAFYWWDKVFAGHFPTYG